MSGEHSHKASSWVVVVLIVVSSIILGIAFVAQNLPLAIVGGVLGLAGVVVGGYTKMMDDAY